MQDRKDNQVSKMSIDTLVLKKNLQTFASFNSQLTNNPVLKQRPTLNILGKP